ncbi:MAG: EAL domain-containing protein [Candidatus Hydrogenedentes bacterium]|nr:EAL domain-containing protein [Candidatus Hydrogenedentota bacterium]
MSLRVRIELLFIAAIALVIGVGYGHLWFTAGRDLSGLTDELAQRDISQCVETVRDCVLMVDTMCSDWAVRPDVTRFVVSGRSSDVPDLLRSPVAQTDLSFIFILNADGRVLFSNVVDQDVGRNIEIRELPAVKWPVSHPLFKPTTTGTSLHGVFLTNQGPALVASHPVFDPSGDGRRRVGALVVGRIVDKKLLLAMRAKTRVAFRLWAITDRAMPDDVNAFIQTNPVIDQPYNKPISADLVRAYTLYPDVLGHAALILSTEVSSSQIGDKLAAIHRGLMIQVVIALGALLVLMATLRQDVTLPILRMTQYCKAVLESGYETARLRVTRRGDIGKLADALDKTIKRLNEDVKSRTRTIKVLQENEERVNLAMDGANVGMWDWNLKTDRIRFSARWRLMVGYEGREYTGGRQEWFRHVDDRDIYRVEKALERYLDGLADEFAVEHRVKRKDDRQMWVICRGLAIRDKTNTPIRLVGTQIDITDRKLAEERMAHDAFHDALTGLPNRALFLDRLDKEVARLKRKKDYRFAILFIDLDRFKVINDGLGHAVGDELLKSVAVKLASKIRSTDTVGRCEQTVARFGGDEFVVLLQDLGDVRDAMLVADRIQRVVKEPMNIDGHEVYTTASIGIATAGAPDTSVEDMLRHADTAMYRAKAEGGARYAIFDISMGVRAKKRLQLESYLRRAIENRELDVYYQPIVSLATGTIDSLEALVRWHHDELGDVPPEEFIHIAEETGMITGIGQHVLETACRQVRVWQDMFTHSADLGLSVNLTAKDIVDPAIEQTIKRILDESNLVAHYLKIEVTESTIMSNFELVSDTILELKSMGIKISIDDFGTGYSSLSYLHKVAVDILKIDLSFVASMNTSPESMQLVKTIVALAKNLNLDVVAEGIEQTDQLELLKTIGCEFGQGYFFSKPLSANDMTDMLKTNRAWPTI